MVDKDIVLREFSYIDAQKVIDLLSSVENGLSKEIALSERILGSQLEGKLGIQIAELAKKGEQRESESREVKIPTEASIFNRLYKALQKREAIHALPSEISLVSIGKVYEFTGELTISFMDTLYERIKPFLPFMQTTQTNVLKPARSQQRQNISQPTSVGPSQSDMFRILLDRPSISFRVKSQNIYPCVGQGSKKNMKVSLSELEGKYSIMGRAQEIVHEGETYKVYTIQGGLALPTEIISQMRTTFPPQVALMMGRDLVEEDFQMKGPLIVLSPIAIYR